MNTPSSDADVATQSVGSHAGVLWVPGMDSLPGELPSGVHFGESNTDPAQPEQLSSAGVVKRGRGRPRKLVPADGNGNAESRTADAIREPASGWLGSVQAQLEKADGLTDGHLPVKIAQALIAQAQDKHTFCIHCKRSSITETELVAALEKCENMALKLKAAKFLKDTSKGTIDELRQYAAKLMSDDEPDVQS